MNPSDEVKKRCRAVDQALERISPHSAAQIAWDEIDWDACIKNPPKPKKVGTIKAIFKYIGRSKPFSGKVGDND